METAVFVISVITGLLYFMLGIITYANSANKEKQGWWIFSPLWFIHYPIDEVETRSLCVYGKVVACVLYALMGIHLYLWA